MRTRRFENTLREREAVAVGARCRSLGFCSDALLCLCASVPARPSGEQPPPVGARPSRGAGQCAGPSYPCPRPRRAGPAGVILRPPRGLGHRTAEEQGLGAERGSAEAGARGLLKRVKMTGQVRAVSGLKDFQAGAC